jgi:hypothetical protein
MPQKILFQRNKQKILQIAVLEIASVSFIAPLHVIFASDVAEWYCFLCRSHFFSTKKIRLALLFPRSTGFLFL